MIKLQNVHAYSSENEFLLCVFAQISGLRVLFYSSGHPSSTCWNLDRSMIFLKCQICFRAAIDTHPGDRNYVSETWIQKVTFIHLELGGIASLKCSSK